MHVMPGRKETPPRPASPAMRPAQTVHAVVVVLLIFPLISMRLLVKPTLGLAHTRLGFFCKQYAFLSSWQCPETQQLKSSATMGEQVSQEPPDLSTWSTDQLIARVNSLEQQLKEQTVKCVCPTDQQRQY